MKSNKILPLIFGVIGGVYIVLGGVFLSIAVQSAGDLRRIFTLPEEQLAFAINGVVFGVLGIGFLLAAFFLLLASKRRAHLQEELLAWGSRVKGSVAEVRIDHTIRINRKYAHIALVRCHFPTGEVTLRSQRLWYHTPSVGDTVEVLYDPMDAKRYVILFDKEK